MKSKYDEPLSNFAYIFIFKLRPYDVVITTFGTCASEYVRNLHGGEVGTLYNVAWWRVVLDEAHIIRNRRTHSSVAMCALQSSRQGALDTGPALCSLT